MSAEPSYRFDIFLRYHRAQARWAQQLAERLDREGFRVWFDQWMLQPGDDRRIELQRAIDECRWLGIVVSPEWVANPWPKDELYSGFPQAPVRQNQRLLPLIYAPCDLPRPLEGLAGIDFSGSETDPILLEFQTLQLMARLDPNFAAPRDLQRFRLVRQPSQPVEDEEVRGFQSFLRAIQTAIVRAAGGEKSRSSPDKVQQIAVLQFIQRLFQWNSADIQYDRAEEWLGKNNLPEALVAFDRALNMDPNFALAWGRRGEVLMRLGRYREAIDSYNGSLTINPYDEPTRLQLALVLGRQKQYKAAIINYDKVLEMDPESWLAWHNRGIRLAQIQRPKLALASFNQSLTLQKPFPQIQVMRGYTLLTLRRYSAAANCLARGLPNYPKNAALWRWQGLALARSNRAKSALNAYKRALKLQPKQANAWHNQGVILLQLDRYRAAVASFDRAYQQNPDNPQTWHARGVAFQKLGYAKKALIHFDEAIKLKPNYFPAQYARAITLQSVKKYPEALAQFNRILETRPQNFACLYQKVTLLRTLGRWSEALKTSEDMTRLNPQDPLGWFALGITCADSSELEAALQHYSQVLELTPTDSTTLNNRAWVLSQLNRFEEGIPLALNAVELNSRKPAYWHTLGVCQHGSGLIAEATQSLKQALQLDPKFEPAQALLEQWRQNQPLPELAQLSPEGQPIDSNPTSYNKPMDGHDHG